MIRILTMAGGFAGALGLSQFPEFSQQYLQRLSGAVDELRAVVVAFDASAAKAGISREEALSELTGSTFLSEHQDNLDGQIVRFERLSRDYTNLKEAQPLQRLTQAYRFSDADLARRTWDDFRPAVPVTIDGFICAGIGFVAVSLTLSLLVGLFGRVFRRRRPADTESQRLDLGGGPTQVPPEQN
ncbi:MAG: DUF2937 family protein [Rhodobacteraceae bacterium]|nr:DUF2937 family protein [Paracoccaceae bacterium]